MALLVRLFGIVLLSVAGGCAVSHEAVPASAAATPERSTSITGVIVSADGHPIPGAIVVIAHEVDGTILYGGGEMLSCVERRADQLPGAGKLAGNVTGRAVTGADGSFRFDDVAEGPFTLAAVDPQRGIAINSGVNPQSAPMTVELGQRTFLTAQLPGLRLEPEWSYVDLEAESPWANVQLALRMNRAERAGAPRTPDEFTAGPIPDVDQWTIVAKGLNQSRGFASPLLSAPISLERGVHNQVIITAGHQEVTGRVIGPAGESMADIGVRARPMDVSTKGTTRGAFTAGDGTFVIEGLETGAYTLEAVRYRLRSDIGCGYGPIDVECSKTVRVPLESESVAELHIESLIPPPKAGDAVRDFSSRAVDGTTIDLSAYRGKVVLLDFWATWCSLCLVDMKHIAALHDELAPHGEFVVIGISLDSDPRAVERFLLRQRLPWPQLVLGPADRNPIARLYNVTSTPTTVLLDRDGRIAATHVPGESLRDKVAKLLDNEPARAARNR